jgi:hypothetical protein
MQFCFMMRWLNFFLTEMHCLYLAVYVMYIYVIMDNWTTT